MTNRRLAMPTCVAASPTPGAAYMVSNMSSASFLSSASNLVTGSAGVVSTGSGQVTIFNRAILYFEVPCLSVFASKRDFTIKDEVSLVEMINPQITQIHRLKRTGEGKIQCRS